jgi:NAD(P)-dependent dehydrogenase (short-subunit alcohol dehydrogenase family)
VIGFAKTLSLELARDRITIDTICPGFIETTRLEKSSAGRPSRGSSRSTRSSAS